jgi:N-methylhydantoinase A/oxoprolinase/acetone carboxylase beta subunit
MYRIGVDVGGTNTDAVVMVGRDVLAVVKVPTTPDVMAGLMEALSQVLETAGILTTEVDYVVIGTTHFTNAVVERRNLEQTAVIRLCLPAAQCLWPMADWPDDLAAAVGTNTYLASGGLEYDGTPIASFNSTEITRIGHDINKKGLKAIAICGVFSPINDVMEQKVSHQLAQICGQADITTSAPIGGLGLLAREGATILNGALLALARRTITGLRQALDGCGMSCPLFISQNDGTLMDCNRAQRFPVLTFASGPTNSMRGAAFLTGHLDAIVIDVGGTTTDVGLLQGGFPRQATTTVNIGGVRTNFRMPDLLSIGLGGGSIVLQDGAAVRVGPRSVAWELERVARVFGGPVLTATDIGVASQRATIGNPQLVRNLDPALVVAAQREIDSLMEAAIDRTRVSALPVPVIAVGGGSILLTDRVGGVDVVRPQHYAVANAIGAAIAQTSGEIDRVFSLDKATRQEVLAAAENEARQNAILAGAITDTIVITEREDVPLAYLPGNATRIRIKAVGDMRV